MTARSRGKTARSRGAGEPPVHPSLLDWMQWLRGRLDGARAAQLQAHLQECARCTKDRELLAPFYGAVRVGPLSAPPRRARERVRRLPAQRPAPPAPARPHSVRWPARDVRGFGPASTGESAMVARSCPGAEISVMATPPRGDGRWRIEGRVWLHQPDARAIGVVLAHDDHVLATAELRDGGQFALEEIVSTGWTLEFHLPAGGTLVLKDPFA
jgi:hypothetical protein